jgi:hypothetical protein
VAPKPLKDGAAAPGAAVPAAGAPNAPKEAKLILIEKFASASSSTKAPYISDPYLGQIFLLF